MPFTRFANLDFDEIKTSIKDYLRSNSNFTDFDFEGSNFSVLIDILAYNTYITAFNANMVVNESFLDSATVRENVVSLARNVGYVPRSRRCSRAVISFDVNLGVPVTAPTQLILKSGLVCIAPTDNSSYVFSIPENIITTVDADSAIASFTDIEIYQGNLITQQFANISTLNYKFILTNANIDTSTIVVKVNGIQYNMIDNITEVNDTSEIYLIQEIEDNRYQIIFGDGILGKKLEGGSTVDVSYIITKSFHTSYSHTCTTRRRADYHEISYAKRIAAKVALQHFHKRPEFRIPVQVVMQVLLRHTRTHLC
jgi:hypothetical protein